MIRTVRFPVLTRLALRDLGHGWQSTACLVVAVSVALIPLMLLYGLKFGIVTNLIDALRDDPRVREIRLIRDQPLNQEWFADLEADPRIGFILPRARYLSSIVRIRSEEARRALEVRMIPTIAGDPYLQNARIPTGFDEIALTERVSIETKSDIGDTLRLDILRVVGEFRQRVRIDAEIVAIVPRDMLQTDDIFVSPLLENSIERWREGFAVPEQGWEAARDVPPEAETGRQFSSFRLFASDVRDVPALRDRLLADGLDVETRASEVERTLAIEAGLGWIFVAVTTLSAVGFLLTLGLHLAASVVEKARELSILRLLGLKSIELSIMPSMQGIFISAAGAMIACIVAMAAQPVVNASLTGLAGLEGQVSRLDPLHFLFAVVAASVVGGLAGSAAGLRAAALEPTQGLRSE